MMFVDLAVEDRRLGGLPVVEAGCLVPGSTWDEQCMIVEVDMSSVEDRLN